MIPWAGDLIKELEKAIKEPDYERAEFIRAFEEWKKNVPRPGMG